MDCPNDPGCQSYNTPQIAPDRFYLNNGAGIFSDTTDTIIASAGNATATLSLALADMDGDNDPDVVRYGYWGSYTGTRLLDNHLGFYSVLDPRLDSSGGREIVLTNFDDDAASTRDVFIPRTNEYPIYLVQDGGGFVDHSHYSVDDWLPGNTSYSSDYRDSVAAASADVDLDGDPDVVIGRKNNEYNRLFINNNDQPGHFDHLTGRLPNLSESTYGVTFGDVNGDGVPDLFFANVGQKTLLINNTKTPCRADLDGEGDVDGTDLSIFNSAYANSDQQADINGDGSVGAADVEKFSEMLEKKTVHSFYSWANYEITEVSCDDRDNDCDGTSDENLIQICGPPPVGQC